MPRLRLQLFVFIGLLCCFHSAFSQCFQIESILVDACDTGSNEGFNEMVRFKVGNAALNTSNLSVTWPNNSWTGLIQDAGTAAKVVQLNAQVAAAGGCGQILEPVGGVLPANAKVVLVTSFNFGVTANVFGALTQNLYIIFQNNPTVTTGHFANYNATSGIRTLIMNFGACNDTVSYDRSLLVNINGTSGGTAAEQNGSTVNFTPAGIASYVNTGCVAPIETFTVDAGPPSVSACPGAVIALSGTATGTVQWTAPIGIFSASNALVTNYTIPANASGSIVLTLTATNVCSTSVSDAITVNIVPVLTPVFNAIAPVCSGTTLNPLPATSTNGINGTWSPALNNTATTTYTFTPLAGQCAASATLTITVNQPVAPTFSGIIQSICLGGDILPPLPAVSTNGITGTWSPTLNMIATTTYTFTPDTGQCATPATLTITVNPVVTPTFNPVASICIGSPLSPLPATSLNGITGSWSPALNNTATTTYTFTPNAGQCATTAALIIVVGTGATPQFNAVAPICAGDPLSPLPTTSLNGIFGAWSPALNNTATTTYTFTPIANACFNPATLTIVVNQPNVVPVFTAVAPVCSGISILPLPAISNNGITGSWSPAINNTETTTYIFTPDAGQCAANATLAIVVLPDNFDFNIKAKCADAKLVLYADNDNRPLQGPGFTFEWKDANGNSTGLNNPDFNVSDYVASTPQAEAFPIVFSLTVTTEDGCRKTRIFTVESIYCNIQKGISPNGDSSNEFFDLANKDVKRLSIFNRYGTKVYSRQSYTNQWKGQADNGNELPDATYYYVIDFNGSVAPVSGWIYINR